MFSLDRLSHPLNFIKKKNHVYWQLLYLNGEDLRGSIPLTRDFLAQALVVVFVLWTLWFIVRNKIGIGKDDTQELPFP